MLISLTAAKRLLLKLVKTQEQEVLFMDHMTPRKQHYVTYKNNVENKTKEQTANKQ